LGCSTPPRKKILGTPLSIRNMSTATVKSLLRGNLVQIREGCHN